MVITLPVVIFLYLQIHPASLKVSYVMEKADDLIESIVGKVYKVKHNLPMPRSFSNISLELSKQYEMNEYKDYYDEKHENKRIPFENRTFNFILEEAKGKRNVKYIRDLIERRENPIPDFQNNVDDIELITRRFNNMLVLSNLTQPNRRLYRSRQYSQDLRELVQQFIYMTQYRLIYSQRLRNKYKNLIRYKIGYCFSLLRNLKQQQMVLWNALNSLVKRRTSFFFHVTVYEKVTKLDVDIKDLIKYIKKLEYERKIEEDPNYYDDINYQENILANLSSSQWGSRGKLLPGIPGVSQGPVGPPGESSDMAPVGPGGIPTRGPGDIPPGVPGGMLPNGPGSGPPSGPGSIPHGVAPRSQNGAPNKKNLGWLDIPVYKQRHKPNFRRFEGYPQGAGGKTTKRISRNRLWSPFGKIKEVLNYSDPNYV